MSIAYRPEVDGLRAVAVVSVILHHAHAMGFAGGFVGVDVFFVISGYLITSIIAGEIEAGKFSIASFYERRIRRILPALYLMMAVTIPLAWMLMIPIQFRQFGDSLVAVCLFISNMLFWKEENYFAPESADKPLLHTWSLGIEEQFYLFFPLALILLWRFGRRPTGLVLVGAGLCSLALTEWGWRHAPTGNFYLFPTRAWELIAGSLCALYLMKRARRPNEALSALGLAGIVGSVVLMGQGTPFPSLLAIIPVAGSAFIILFADGRTVAGRLLGSRLFVGIGLISYSAYLWHQPLFAFARLGLETRPSPSQMLMLSVVALGLGYLSWRFVERPFRDRKRFSFRFMATGAAVGCAAFVSLGLAIHWTKGWEAVWASHQSARARQVIALWNVAEQSGRDFGAKDDGACRFNVGALNGEVERRIDACARRLGKGVLVIGDSHGIDLFGSVISRARNPFVIGITQGGCLPHRSSTECDYPGIARYLGKRPGHFGSVIFEEAGFVLLSDGRGTDARNIFLSTPVDQAARAMVVDTGAIDRDIAWLRSIAAPGRNVYWLGPRLEPMIDLRVMMRRGCDYPYRLRPGQEALYAGLDAEIARRMAGIPGITYVSQQKAMAFRFPRDLINCKRSLWQDTDHYSAAGEAEFAKRLPPIWDFEGAPQR